MRKTLHTNFTTNKLHKFVTQTLLREICVHWTARKICIKYAKHFFSSDFCTRTSVFRVSRYASIFVI